MPRKVGFILGQVWKLSNSPQAAGGSCRRMVCLHGAESHSGWFAPFARQALATGHWSEVIAKDRAGWRGDVPSMEAAFAWIGKSFDQARPNKLTTMGDASRVDVVATSWGALAALAFLFDGPREAWRNIDTLHLVAPGIFPHKRLQCRIFWRGVAESFFGGGFISGRVPLDLNPDDFAEEPEINSWIAADPLRNREVSWAFLRVTAALQRIVRKKIADGAVGQSAGSLGPAVFFHLPTKDPVIDLRRTTKLLCRGNAIIMQYPSRQHGLVLQHPELLSAAIAKLK